MNTKYGELNDDLLNKYFDRLVSKVFKLLPLKEEENPTLSSYLESLILELYGGKELINHLQENPEYLTLLMSLESLNSVNNMIMYKKEIFKCINIIKKLQSGS